MSPPQQVTSGRRALRPAPLSRKSTTGPPPKKSPLGKMTAAGRHTAKREELFDSDHEDDALPSFCGLCEKQIVTPGQILYCSEQCRRKDEQKPIMLSPQTPRVRSEDSLQDILPMQSPTIIRPPSLAFSDDSYDGDQQQHLRSDNDTTNRLSQFFGTEQSRFSMPSLSNTPSSVMSTHSYMSSRPLTRRSDPYSASFSSLSVDLVVPVAETAPSSFTSTTTIGELEYKKQFVGSPSRSSLLSHGALKTPPRRDRPSSH